MFQLSKETGFLLILVLSKNGLNRKIGGYQMNTIDLGNKYVFGIPWIESGYNSENGLAPD